MLMEWEDILELEKILQKYELPYEIGNYYDKNTVIGHWLIIHECYIDSKDI